MLYNYISLLNFSLLPELFLGISIIYLIVHSSIMSSYISKKANVISSFYLALLILFFTLMLLLNTLDTIGVNSIYFYLFVVDYVSQFSKIVTLLFTISCLILYIYYFTVQKMNQFEYIILILIAVLGILLLCSANDLFVAYLAIEIQSLSFYVLTTFKKDSIFSINAGLKYFILGAIASSLYLFGSSLIYGSLGTTNLEDIKFFVKFYGISKFLNIDYIVKSFSTNLSFFQFYNNSDNNLLVLINELKSTIDYIINDHAITQNPVCKSVEQNVLKFSAFLGSFSFIFDYNYNSCDGELVFFYFVYFLKESFELNFLNFTNNSYEIIISYIEYLIHINKSFSLFSLLSFSIIENTTSFLKSYVILKSLSGMTFLNNPVIIEIALILIISSLFFKLAIVPFNFWLPDVYEGALSSTTSFFAIIPKLSIILFFIRLVFCGIFEFVLSLQYLVIFLGFLSIVYGSFSGIEERKLKSLLAFSAISNMGFIFLVMGSNTVLSGQIMIGYLFIYMLANLCIWVIIFIFNPMKFVFNKKYNKELSNFSNFFKSNPIAAFLFSLLLFSLAGLPPFIGFLAKFGIFTIVIDSSLYLLAVFSILSSCIATFYYLRLIKIMFFEKTHHKVLYKQVNSIYYIIFILLFVFLIFLFINPNLLYLSLIYLF